MARQIRIRGGAFSSDTLLRFVLAGTPLRARTATTPGVYDFSDEPGQVWQAACSIIERRVADMQRRGFDASIRE